MPLHRDEDGRWTINIDESDGEEIRGSHPAFLEALPRYMTALDPPFSLAKERDELQFLFTLFRVRGFQDAGWDPYETSLRAIPALVDLYRNTDNVEAADHLALWVYGHIVEASEPYELLANLVDVANGGHFNAGSHFPPKRGRRPWSPGEKAELLRSRASAAGLSGVVAPLEEIWDRDLRNAIFHADYVLYEGGVRTLNPAKSYSREEMMTIVNRAIAYHAALAALFSLSIESYDEPKVIPNSPHFSADPGLQWVVIVRKGHGAAGVKSTWTADQIKAGKIPVSVGRFYPGETRMLDNDPSLSLLPGRAGLEQTRSSSKGE